MIGLIGSIANKFYKIIPLKFSGLGKNSGKLFLIILIILQTTLDSTGQNTIFFENFNGSSTLPTGWTQIQVSGTDVWTINNGGYYDNGSNHPAAAYSGTRNAFLFSPTSPPSSNTRKLVTPSLDLSGLTNITLTFYEARLKWGVDKDQLKVYYRTSATGNWTQLAAYTTETTGWVQRTITLTNPSATYFVAFEGIAQYGYGICIDDVKITATIGNDASLTDLWVENKNTVKAVVKNLGTNTLTTLDVNLSINQGTTITKSWTGSLTTGNSTTITIASNISFPHGLSELKAWTSNPNGSGDGNKSNDSFSRKYTLIRYFPYQEGFESANLGYWVQSTTDDMDWTRYTGSTPSSTTGPTAAYEGNYYIYTEASGFSPYKKAEIYTVDFEISTITNPYLEFWCHMYGNQMGELHIDIDSAGTWINDIITPLSGNKGNQWFKVLVNLNNYRYLNKIRFRGITGTGFLSDMAIDDVKIIDIPNPKLGNDLKACMGDTIHLQVDTGYGYAFVWKKTGSSDTLSTTNKLKIATSGTYIVFVTAPYGYSGSDTIKVDFGPIPVAAFSYSSSSNCLKNNLITFTNQSTISSGSLNYLFDLGNQTDTNLVNIQYHYSKAGTYPLSLTVTSDFGCKDTFYDTIVIFPDPEAKFSVNSNYQCKNNNSFYFLNQSTISSGNLNYLWYFGDNDSSSLKNPVHSYVNSDTFKVVLIVGTDKNCKDTFTDQVYVMSHPIAAFQINDTDQCLKGNYFTFINQSVISYGNLSYQWDFGNLGSSTATHPVFSFQNEGKYAVKLVATSNIGCKDSLTKNVYVNPMPVAVFSVSDSAGCIKTNSFYFNDLSTINTGNISSWLWKFGDGTTTNVANPIKSYTADNTYMVRLIVESDKGCVDSTYKLVRVYPDPTADFQINQSGQCLKDNYFIFTNQSYIKNGTLQYQWDLGDQFTSDSLNIRHSYAKDGKFNVKLLVISNKGCKDSLIKEVDIYPMPVAGFTINKRSQCIEGNNYLFYNQTYLKSGSYNSYWNFGDGNVSQDNNPSNKYQKADTFEVKLIVITNDGCTDSMIKQVYVRPMPEAMFEVNDSDQCFASNHFEFSNNSKIKYGILNYRWDFGDQTESTDENPVKSFDKPGIYTVKLVSESSFNCTDSFTHLVYIFPMPSVFLGNDTAIYDTSSILLDAGSGFSSYLWQDSTSNRYYLVDSNLGHGYFTFSVSVTDSNGCSASDTIIIEIKRSVSLPEEKGFRVKIYPNPVKDYFILEGPSQELNLYSIHILGIDGKEVYSEKLESGSGTNRIIIKTDWLKPGTYLIQLRGDLDSDLYKIIKVQ